VRAVVKNKSDEFASGVLRNASGNRAPAKLRPCLALFSQKFANRSAEGARKPHGHNMAP
jgi:hypothetical protein